MKNLPSGTATLTLDELDRVQGGYQWEGRRQSTNVEDRRPQSMGGPVPDAVWQQEQDSINNSCWIGWDRNEYSGDPNGGPPQQIPRY